LGKTDRQVAAGGGAGRRRGPRSWANPELQPVHLLLGLVEDREGVIPAVLEKIGAPIERLESELHQIEEKLPRVSGAAAQPAWVRR